MKFEEQRRGVGTGAVAAAVIVIILIAAAAYFIFVPGSSPSSTTTTTSSVLTTTSSSTTTTSSSSTTTTSSSTTTTSSSSTTTTSSSTTSSTTTSSSSTTSSTTTSTTSSSSASVTPVTVIMPQGVGTNQNLNFQPSKITVVVGVNNTIIFQDQDSTAPHNVWFLTIPSGATNPNTAAGQSSGYVLLKGKSVTYTLTTPGTYDYDCQFHSTWMQGVITVVQ